MPKSLSSDSEEGAARFDPSAACLLSEGRALQLAGRLDDAAESFADAADAAKGAGEQPLLAESFRRLGIVHHLRGEAEAALDYCTRSRDVALTVADNVLAAEATMALANFATEYGRMDDAGTLYSEARELAAGNRDLTARIEQNLGILDTVHGDLESGLRHHQEALASYEAAGNVLGCAMTHHNIGMIHADRQRWDPARHAYESAASLAQQGGDCHLEGLCLVNLAEVDLSNRRYEEARRRAEAALGIFERLEARLDKADAYRILGTAFRFLNRPTLAESRLRSALDIATSTGSQLGEAEACRDLAGLYESIGLRSQALGLVDRALDLCHHIGARRDIPDLMRRRKELMVA